MSDIRHQAAEGRVPERGDTHEQAHGRPSLQSGGSVQATEQGVVIRGEPSGLRELMRQSWEPRAAETTAVPRAEYQRGESCTQRKLQRLAEDHPQVFSRILISTCV